MLQLSFVNFKKDSYIVIEGQEASDRFYIIQSGYVHCVHEVPIPVNGNNGILGPGDFVGVIPCMSNHRQIESAIAMTDVVCISVKHSQYPELIERNTPVAMKIIKTFANKMRMLNENLTKLALNKVVQDSPDQIFATANYYDFEKKPSIALYGYYQYLKENPSGRFAQKAKERFVELKPIAQAVYLDQVPDMVRFYPQNTMIFSESQTGSDMFIIQEGSVRIVKIVNGQEVILAVLKKGDMFGEMALIENKPRSASAIAHENCKLMTVNRKNFDQMVSTQPQLIARLTTTLADRLWSMYRQLGNTRLHTPYMKLIDMLCLQMEKSKVSFAPGTSYQTDLTVQNIVDMCGIPQDQQAAAAYEFQTNAPIKLVGGKIFVPKCMEFSKMAAVFRKQSK